MAHVVSSVQLPERTRARMGIENELQRTQKPHDIRSAIPLVDYTNPAKFPPYVKREYPKMPLLDNNRPIVINESGDVLIFYEAADEAEFREMNPEIVEEIDRNAPEKSVADRIVSQANEIDNLRAKLRAAGIEDEETAKSVNPLAGAVKPAAGGLRGTLPSNGNGGSNNPLKK